MKKTIAIWNPTFLRLFLEVIPYIPFSARFKTPNYLTIWHETNGATDLSFDHLLFIAAGLASMTIKSIDRKPTNTSTSLFDGISNTVDHQPAVIPAHLPAQVYSQKIPIAEGFHAR